ncbi:hypothetical protein Vadar_002529 [Vaccinium darrowii]|uniref:Uncharacterized protein n=1 Tax=Vaccinium darrowii TaxID=229202 RepID=A0ACB7YCE2_9ERIC|nr:hypothetical protein Vadar_002529 [Vaccinium darrowii]
MLQIFYDSQDFYLLKELEKLGPKKGVISQSVKDVVQSLVDDDLVLKDKIGTSVYFWSLPSCAGNQLRNVRRKLEADLQSSKKRLAELVEQREALKRGREESDEREEALGELKSIEKKYNELKRNLLKLRTLQLTDGQAKEELDHMYNEAGITDDFDYLELPPIVPQGPVGDKMLEDNP